MAKLSDISTIKDVLSKYGFSFSKSMGQNFLINPSVCPKMACQYSSDDCVIEVGPGIGVLTYELAKNCKKVVSIELDKRLLPILSDTLGEFDNVKIINDDILKIDLHKLLENEFSSNQVSVCANLPYYITSPVIMRLLEEKLNLKNITVMVQKEAGMRICAKPATRESSAITIAVRYYCDPEILFHVSKGSFMPAPNVDSCVIRLNLHKKPPVTLTSEEMFFKVVKSAFSQRRKTILNTLSFGMKLSKDEIRTILGNVNIPENFRAEQLTLQNFADISNELSKIGEF